MTDAVEVYSEFLPLVLFRYKAVDIDEFEDLKTAEILYQGRIAVDVAKGDLHARV